MKHRLFLTIFILAIAASAVGQGVTDFVVDPAETHNIKTAGSYRLAANVTMTADVPAIYVTANDVTIDLNGHTLTGLAGGSASVNGIDTNVTENLNVNNGRIRGFAGFGLLVSSNDAIVSDLKVVNCGRSGISVGGVGAHVRDCYVRGNGEHGIFTGNNALVEGCTALSNNAAGGSAGIRVGGGATVRGCTSSGNSPTAPGGTTYGIYVDFSCTVIDCVAIANIASGNGQAYGIAAGSNCVIKNNNASGNNCNTEGTFAVGIAVGQSSQVIGNVCNSNREGTNVVGTSIGISAGVGVFIENNTCSGNSAIGANGSGRGINTSNNCLVRGNNIYDNDGAGTGDANGINAGFSNCTIERNTVTGHNGGVAGWGIFINALNSLVRDNSTNANGTGGIRINVVGAGGNTVRGERNRGGETTAYSDAGGNSVGAGEDANISY